MTAGAGAVVPVRLVYQVLTDAAQDQGLNAYSQMGGMTVVMCAGCWPDQPAMILVNGKPAPWRQAMNRSRGQCRWEGAARIQLDMFGAEPRDVLLVDAMLDRLHVQCCCHEADEALRGWDWRVDLAARLARIVRSDPDADITWQRQYEERVARVDAAAEEMALRRALKAVAVRLTHRERVKALLTVMKAAGHQVTQQAALVTWPCVHTAPGGRWSSVGWQVEVDGLPGPAESHCREAHANEPQIDLGALLEEYQRISLLPTSERAGYAPVRKPKEEAAPRRVKIEGEQAVAWLDGLDLPLDQRPRVPTGLSQRQAWELAKEYPEPRPTQTSVRVAMAAREGS